MFLRVFLVSKHFPCGNEYVFRKALWGKITNKCVYLVHDVRTEQSHWFEETFLNEKSFDICLYIKLTSMTSVTPHSGLPHCTQLMSCGLNVSVLTKQIEYKDFCGLKTSSTPGTVSWNKGCTSLSPKNVISIILVLTGDPCLVYRTVKMENPFLQQSASLISLRIQEWKCTERW